VPPKLEEIIRKALEKDREPLALPAQTFAAVHYRLRRKRAVP
jgi:hypothetical protein